MKDPVAEAGMLIRRPIAEVFEAFVNPAVTSRFWFTRGSDRLAAGKEVRWDWDMYGQSANVTVKEFELNRRVLIDWGNSGSRTMVEWTFSPRGEHATMVTITNRGFKGDPDDVVKQAIGSTGGFTLVLCGLKALLEHHVDLNLIADRFPDAVKSR